MSVSDENHTKYHSLFVFFECRITAVILFKRTMRDETNADPFVNIGENETGLFRADIQLFWLL